ncbi:YczE/YyaS/YitT family protein [Lactobacillus mulieris]|uniref:YitT family protein n=1 Tax=Lactobacillus mulieris TaxID=2508708 RepID=A0AAW5WX46_9LACO|nr:hypothetical protein [Lactobacillus mulieris]MCZ3622125.1 hypothetical protein [Lactobacillus mulieris]MCZ3623822.1 hypothetical protein [Lactobacillus mulieris]MCZ3636132.1 hypothetical protein [Lactobacillus mulieris]MCZ3689937.1 hypothetical protein [Lactobacillus mulieris]MCZ3696582.1 hypothetical protein [Lactobacillus mulieris]
MKKKLNFGNIALKTLMSIMGVTVLSIGATFLRGGNVGLDPFTAINTGISNKLGLGLGVYQLSVNFVIFLLILWLDRKKIGIGTFVNMILVGFEIQFFTQVYEQLFPEKITFLVIVADTVIGLLLFTLGSSLYMGPKLGVAPYDAIAPIFSERLKSSYKITRIIQDVLFMVGALIMGGPVGFATIIVAFFTGPLITWWNEHVSDPLVAFIDHLTRPDTRNKVTVLLSAMGRRTYESVARTYEATEVMQARLGRYSNSDLKTQQKIARRNLANSKQTYENCLAQYKMIEEELNKRKNQ